MRKLLLLALALTIAMMLVGCRRGPDPSRYDDREPLPAWEITMRSTGGFDLAEMRFVELNISYDRHGEITHVRDSENDLGHMRHNENSLPAWQGYVLWDVLLDNGIFELPSDESMTTSNQTLYEIEARLGSDSNRFKIYAPNYNRDTRYNRVVKAIEELY